MALPPAPRRDEHVADHGPPQAGGPRGLPGARVQEHDRRVEDRSPGREPGWDRRNDDRHDEGLRPPAARDAHRDERQDDRHVPRDRPDSDWARDHDHDRDRGRDHGRRDGPRWDQHRYPPIYDSPSRYRGPGWRPPHGYYARAWRFGDILPRGWYGPQYQLLDWWAYDLPEPPYGYDWVRVGRDALLIDGYTGRIVQVVRLVFW